MPASVAPLPDALRRHLDRVPLLAGWPAAARARFTAAAQQARYAAGEVIFRRNDPSEGGMLLVLNGLVRLHLAKPGGRELTLALAGAGEPVGELAIIDDGPRSADAT